MNKVWLELVVIFVLLGVNGIFAMTEIAVVSARKTKLRQLATAGNGRAKLALELAESPNRFLSTVQVGITLVGILAGAFGGATIAEEISKALQAIPVLAPYGDGIGLAVVVVAITYFSLIIGELVPKRIGLGNPEGIAMRVARPMHTLSVIAGPLVRFLSASTDALLRLFRVRPEPEAVVTEDEVKGLMQEGLRAGAFNKVESQIVQRVLDLDLVAVRDIMTPRAKIIWINREDAHESVWHKIVVSGHSFFPVYEGNRDHVVGIVSVKAIYANVAANVGAKICDLMVAPLIVPATQMIIQLLDTFKQTGKHIALVADEFGSIVGLITLHDVMQAVLGDFASQDERSKPAAVRREDGSWLIDAMIDVESVEAAVPGLTLGSGEGRDFQTLAGFVVKQLSHVPKEGETLEWGGYTLEVIDMDRHRVDKVLLIPNSPRSTNGQ
jgi:putative hemolysin